MFWFNAWIFFQGKNRKNFNFRFRHIRKDCRSSKIYLNTKIVEEILRIDMEKQKLPNLMFYKSLVAKISRFIQAYQKIPTELLAINIELGQDVEFKDTNKNN